MVDRGNEDGDPFLERLSDRIREPVAADESAVHRLKSAIREQRRPGYTPNERPWRTGSIRLRPASAGLGLALLVVFGFLLGRFSAGTTAPPGPADPIASRVTTQFVLVAEQASRVSVVGDFNEWEPTATPMSRSGTSGVWSVEVRLPPGRHEYSFLVDGREWVPDANAPRSPPDDFGMSNSVVLVQAGNQ